VRNPDGRVRRWVTKTKTELDVSGSWLAPGAIVDTATETRRRLWETPVSRVWNALKEAERERAHLTQRNGIENPDKPSERESPSAGKASVRRVVFSCLFTAGTRKSSRSTKRPRHLKSKRTGLCCGWRQGSSVANGCS
jgi:hypothetical protein